MTPLIVDEKNAEIIPKIMAAFARTFPKGAIKIKPGAVKNNRALALHYVDSRAVMDRLDEVVGVNCWKDSYTLVNGEVQCELSVKIAGEWVTKTDVGGQSEQDDEGDRMKAAYSDALKRAAVKFGIGRYLYSLPQQWLDYDPVRKRFIQDSDAQKEAPPPAPKPSDKPATPPEPVRTQGASAYATELIGKLARIEKRDEAVPLWNEYSAKKGGVLPLDKQLIEAAFSAFAQRMERKAAAK